jgi:hypothetical protein
MKDKTVAILESRMRDHIASLVRKYGGTPFSAPALAEIPDVDPAHIHALIRDWNSTPPEIIIFQTGVGTRALFGATDSLGLTGVLLRLLDAAQVIVRGPKPASSPFVSLLEHLGAGDTGRRPHHALVERLSLDRPNGPSSGVPHPKAHAMLRTHAGHRKSAKGLVRSESSRFGVAPDTRRVPCEPVSVCNPCPMCMWAISSRRTTWALSGSLG